MKLIVCLENSGGMSFFGRRVSRDIVVYEDICNTCKGKKLYMNKISIELFEEINSPNCERSVVADYLSISPEDFLFLEDNLPGDLQGEISELIIYRWNRDYPHDVSFDIDMSKFRLFSKKEFAGKSHEKITCETYKAV